MKKELVESLNGYISNIGVCYIKLHNLHWNLKGAQFKAVHEYLETLYDAFAEALDQVAELLRMDDLVPVASMREFLSLATIKELGGTVVDTGTALELVLKDMETLTAQAKEIRRRAEAEDHFAAANMMEDNMAGYSKNIWFLKSMLG